MVILGELQETLEEQDRACTGLSESLQALTKNLTKKQTLSQNENMEPDQTENISTENGERWIRQQAKLAPESLKPFDENNVYDILIEQIPRTRREEALVW